MVGLIIPSVLLVAGLAVVGVAPGVVAADEQGNPHWIVILLWLLLAWWIVGKIARTISEAMAETRSNMQQPLLAVSARVVAKRFEVSGGWDMGGSWNNLPISTRHYSSMTTRYYVTYELETGERFEYSVSGREYGMLTEGDQGTLSRQGTWYKGFVRQAKPEA